MLSGPMLAGNFILYEKPKPVFFLMASLRFLSVANEETLAYCGANFTQAKPNMFLA